MPVQAGIIYPKWPEGSFQLLAQSSRPGFIVRQKETLGGTAANGNDGQIPIQVLGGIRTTKAKRVSCDRDDRIEGGDDVVLDMVLFVG